MSSAGAEAAPKTRISSQSRSGKGERIPELDGVRGLAIAFVLLYHYANVSVSLHSLAYYALLPLNLLWSGVDFFFVLSGLLIGGLLMDHRDSPHYFSTFYMRRVYRIFPIYYLMIALLVAGVWAFPHSPLFAGNLPLWTFPLYAQNLTGNFTAAPIWIGVSWSLAIEEQFYLIFPFIVRQISRRGLLWFSAACILGALLLRIVLVFEGWPSRQTFPLLPCRADALAFGVLAAILLRSDVARIWIGKHSRLLYGCLALSIASLATTLKWIGDPYMGAVGFSLFAACYFLLILLLLAAPLPFLTTGFRAPWLRWLGRVSYCTYLIHQPVRVALFLLLGLGSSPAIAGPATFLATLGALGLTLAIAQTSWMLLERRLIGYAHWKFRY